MTEKLVGVYAGDIIPGIYTKTLTGVERGVELFSRPDLTRPWRSRSKQKKSHELALREKEIEELLRLCSKLRSQLANSEHDCEITEYTLEEKANATSKAKDVIILELRDELESEKKKVRECEEKLQHHIRLLKNEQESEISKYKNEMRCANETFTEAKNLYEQQIKDVKEACTREIVLVESRIESKVQELNTQLKMEREKCEQFKSLHNEEKANFELAIKKVESEFANRSAETEERIALLKEKYEAELHVEKTCKANYLEQFRKLTVELTSVKAVRQEEMERNITWCKHLITKLERCFTNLINLSRELGKDAITSEEILQAIKAVTTSNNLDMLEEVSLFAPKTLLEQPENKAVMERTLSKIVEIELLSHNVLDQTLKMKHLSNSSICQDHGDIEDSDSTLHTSKVKENNNNILTRINRLHTVIEQLIHRQVVLEADCAVFSQQATFFNDNLINKTDTNSRLLPPLPSHKPFFVGLQILNARMLWKKDAELTRILLSLFFTHVRCWLASHGGYECYFSDTLIILAFSKPASAIMFCLQVMEWYVDCRLRDKLSPLATTPTEIICYQEYYCFNKLHNLNELQLTATIHCGEISVEPSAFTTLGCFTNQIKQNALSNSTFALNSDEIKFMLAKQNLHYYGPCLIELLRLMTTNVQCTAIVISDVAWKMSEKEITHLAGNWTSTCFQKLEVTKGNNECNNEIYSPFDKFTITTENLRKKVHFMMNKMSEVSGERDNHNNISNDIAKDKSSKADGNIDNSNSFSNNICSNTNENNHFVNLEDMSAYNKKGINNAINTIETTMLFTEAIKKAEEAQKMSEIINIVKEEANIINEDGLVLKAESEQCKINLHMLNPTEMIAQMTDLFMVIKNIALHTESICAEIATIKDKHIKWEEKWQQINKKLRAINLIKESAIESQTLIEQIKQNYELRINQMTKLHNAEIYKINQILQERNNLIQQLANVALMRNTSFELQGFDVKKEAKELSDEYIRNKENIVLFTDNVNKHVKSV